MEGMTPQLRAVFDALCDLRLKSGSYIFSFKLSDILKCLDENKESIKYGIGLSEVRDLLDELAIRFNVQLDYVVELDLDNNRVDYRWKYGEYEWVYEDVQVGQDIRDFLGKVYVKIDRPQIKTIKDATEKKYIATLSYEDPCFIITYNGKHYTLPGLTYGKPYTILGHIMKNKLTDKVVGRNRLKTECKISNLEKYSLATDIFESNNQVKILKPFIRIEPQSILINSSAKLTELELQKIINACK